MKFLPRIISSRKRSHHEARIQDKGKKHFEYAWTSQRIHFYTRRGSTEIAVSFRLRTNEAKDLESRTLYKDFTLEERKVMGIYHQQKSRTKRLSRYACAVVSVLAVQALQR